MGVLLTWVMLSAPVPDAGGTTPAAKVAVTVEQTYQPVRVIPPLSKLVAKEVARESSRRWWRPPARKANVSLKQSVPSWADVCEPFARADFTPL